MKPELERPGLTVAIDGPAGAGKSTLARILAGRLGYLYIDTGAMYRALALKALRTGVAIEDSEAVAAMAAQTAVRLGRGQGGANTVLLDGVDVTQEIRDPAVTRIVSKVSASPGLRRVMIEAQRAVAAHGSVVMDGRDIGSYVLPNADIKFFVTASLRERAVRRQNQLAKAGHRVDLAEIEADISRRDEEDRNKGESSLVQASDAVLVDTTGRTIDDVVSEMLSHFRRD